MRCQCAGSAVGSARAISSGTRPPPAVSAMYCGPPDILVIGVPMAPPGRSMDAGPKAVGWFEDEVLGYLKSRPSIGGDATTKRQ